MNITEGRKQHYGLNEIFTDYNPRYNPYLIVVKRFIALNAVKVWILYEYLLC